MWIVKPAKTEAAEAQRREAPPRFALFFLRFAQRMAFFEFLLEE